jgi:predicted nucleic acid-binding protein
VVDSSVIAALVTPEEYSEWASKKLSDYDYFHALDLNYYEVANALRHKTSDRFSANDASTSFMQAAELLNLYTIHNFSEVITGAMTLALDLDITVYDAAFLALAEKLEAQLLTLDRRLAKKLQNSKYSNIFECP